MGKERFATLAEQHASGDKKPSAENNASAEQLRPGKWYLLAAGVLLADQVSKGIASNALIYAVPERVFFWLNLSLHHNEGAAFSFLRSRWMAALVFYAACDRCMWCIGDLDSKAFCTAVGAGSGVGSGFGRCSGKPRR